MGIEFTASADRHDIPHEDVLYAIAHYTASVQIPGRDGQRPATVFVGHPHEQTHRFIEVIVEIRQPRTLIVFHAMELTDMFRWMLDDPQEARDR